MLEIVRDRLSQIDSMVHQKGLRRELISEVKDCFDYFDTHSSKKLGDQPVILIHGNRIELRKVAGEENGYEVDLFVPFASYKEVLIIRSNKVSKIRISYMDGSVIPVHQDAMTMTEVEDVVRRIHRITLPYLEHILKKRHLSSAEASLPS